MSSFDFGSGFCYCLSGDGIKDNGLRKFGLSHVEPTFLGAGTGELQLSQLLWCVCVCLVCVRACVRVCVRVRACVRAQLNTATNCPVLLRPLRPLPSPSYRSPPQPPSSFQKMKISISQRSPGLPAPGSWLGLLSC